MTHLSNLDVVLVLGKCRLLPLPLFHLDEAQVELVVVCADVNALVGRLEIRAGQVEVGEHFEGSVFSQGDANLVRLPSLFVDLRDRTELLEGRVELSHITRASMSCKVFEMNSILFVFKEGNLVELKLASVEVFEHEGGRGVVNVLHGDDLEVFGDSHTFDIVFAQCHSDTVAILADFVALIDFGGVILDVFEQVCKEELLVEGQEQVAV